MGQGELGHILPGGVDKHRTRADYLPIADNVLEVLTQRRLLKPEAADQAVDRDRPAPSEQRPRLAPS